VPDRFDRDAECEQRQHQRAREPGEIADLAGAEGKARVRSVPPREAIGERGGAERARVGRHVHAVGEQRHRAGEQTRDDLDHHHSGGKRDHPPRTALVHVMRRAEKDMMMSMGSAGGAMH
jgi:hypothetical protein